MYNDKVKGEVPANFEELKKAVNRTANWRERIKAVEELGQWRSQQTIDILKRVVAEDSVFKVQEAAYYKLKELREEVARPSKRKGDLVKGVSKILLRIKKSLPEDHTFEDFKGKLKKMRSDIYDTYEGEMGADFNQWLESTWSSLSNK